MTAVSPPQQDVRRGAGLAFLAAAVQTIGTAVFTGGLNPFGYVLLIFSGLVLDARHRSPAGTFVAVAAATVAYQALHYPHGPTFVALAIVVASALHGGHHGLVWVLGPVVFAAWVVLTGATFGAAVTVALWAFGPALLAEAVFGAARMASRMNQEQRRLHEERQRRQTSERRLHIAHELHDVLGHHLSLINVRAGVGRHLLDRDPDQARAALDAIKEASAEALREVRSVLDTLYPTDPAALLAPAPGLDRLDELTVNAGLPVRTTFDGERRALPAEIERAAYRIVREALTNVRRHAAPGATAVVTIDYRRQDEVTVRIDDDGGGRDAVAVVAAGNGISGMRERAAVLGGSLSALPLPHGGWRVRAVIPIPTTESDDVEESDATS